VSIFPYLCSRARAWIAREQEIFALVANLDTTRRTLITLKAEHETLLRRVGIEHALAAEQTTELEAARAEVARLTEENRLWLRQAVEGPTS
jgi:hypothetical protein